MLCKSWLISRPSVCEYVWKVHRKDDILMPAMLWKSFMSNSNKHSALTLNSRLALKWSSIFKHLDRKFLFFNEKKALKSLKLC